MSTDTITLIRPPRVIPHGSFQGQQGVPPIGLAYVASSLRGQGHDVQCIDAVGEALESVQEVPGIDIFIQGLTAEQIAFRVRPTTKAIAISHMFSSELIYLRSICESLETHFPGVPVILGGEAASADYQYLLENLPNVRYICMGEGEETIAELFQHIVAGTGPADISTMAGIAYVDQHRKVVKTERRPRNKCLDQILWPAWDLFPLRNYLDNGLGITTRTQRTIPMNASRGCPYQCTFCSSPEMWTTLWNVRSPENVIAEIRHYKEKYLVENVEFHDLTMIINKKWIIRFCELLIAENLRITWSLPSGTRSEVLDKQTIPLLRDSGCRSIDLAPESGSEFILRYVNKRVSLEKMLEVIGLCSKHKVHTRAHVIFGFPEERRIDVLYNFLLMIKMAYHGLDDAMAYRFTPYPGSKIYNDLVAQGRVPSEPSVRERFLSESIPNSLFSKRCWSRHYGRLELSLYMFFGMAIFYTTSYVLRPHLPFVILYRVVRKKPSSLVDILITDLIRRLKWSRS